MSGREVLDLIYFGTHCAQAFLGLFLNEIVGHARNPAGKLQHSFARIVIRAVGGQVVAYTLEVRGSVLDWPQAKDSFDDELRGIALDAVSEGEKPSPKREQIPKGGVADG